MPQARRTCSESISIDLLIMAREMLIALLLLVAASLLWFGAPNVSQAQQPYSNQSSNFDGFRHVSSPLRPSKPTLRIQEQPEQRAPDKPDLGESSPAEALPNRASTLTDIEDGLKLLEDYTQRTPEVSEEIKSLVEAAKLHLSKAREAMASAADFDEQTRSAPAKIATLEKKLASNDCLLYTSPSPRD